MSPSSGTPPRPPHGSPPPSWRAASSPPPSWPVAGRREGLDLTRGALPGVTQRGEDLAVWRQGNVSGRGRRVLRPPGHLGWIQAKRRHPAYATLPPLDVALDGHLPPLLLPGRFQRGPLPRAPPRNGRGDPVDFTVEVHRHLHGTVAVAFPGSTRCSRLDVRFTKWEALDRALYPSSWEPVFQTVEVPLLRLSKEAGAFSGSPRGLKEVRFVFDRTPRGMILLDEVGFEP